MLRLSRPRIALADNRPAHGYAPRAVRCVASDVRTRGLAGRGPRASSRPGSGPAGGVDADPSAAADSDPVAWVAEARGRSHLEGDDFGVVDEPVTAIPFATFSSAKQGKGAQVAVSLTQGELEVLRLMARGCSNSEIAGELFLSQATAKSTSRACSASSGSAAGPEPWSLPTSPASSSQAVSGAVTRASLAALQVARGRDHMHREGLSR